MHMCFLFSHCLSMLDFGLPPWCPQVGRGAIELDGRMSHFLPRWPRTAWQSVISPGKISWNSPPRPAGNCTGHEEDRQWDSSISPLSYCDWQAMYSQLYILNGSAYSEERQYYCLYFVKRKSTTNSFLPANISGVPEDVGMNLTDSLYTSYGCGGNSARTPLGWI